MWNIPPQGGVVILVRHGLIAELAKLPRKREVDPWYGASGTVTRWDRV